MDPSGPRIECHMRRPLGQSGYRQGYSLGEMIVALVIGSMVLTAILTVYGRANRAAEAVLGKIENPTLAAEVLQRLAEDLDRVLGAEQGASIQIKNGFDRGYARAQLILRRPMRDSKNEEQVFEEITWRAGYDYTGAVPGLIIYRAHEGIDLEDKLLDRKRAGWESNYPLVPICRGVTFFQIEVPRDDKFVDQWAEAALPPGIRVTISFAEPYETVQGTLEVPDEEKIRRTIAIDKTRTIKFTMPATGPGGADPNTDVAAGTIDPASGRTGRPTPGKANESPLQRPGGPTTPGRYAPR